MARRLLSSLFASLALAGFGCQVDPIAIVECGKSADCDSGLICSPDHICVEPDAGTPDGLPPPSHPGELLTWDSAGIVPDGQNMYGIAGAWSLDDDCAGVLDEIANGSFVCPLNSPTKSCCTERDQSLGGPPPLREPGWSVTAGIDGETSGSVCARLTTAAHVIDSQYGAVLALDLNDGAAFDATRVFSDGSIVGFSFDIESGNPASAELRVGVGTTDGDSHYMVLPTPARDAKLFFSQLPYADSEPPNPLDLTALTRLTFAMPSAETASTYDFCVTNLHVLQSSGDVQAPDLPGAAGGSSVPTGP